MRAIAKNLPEVIVDQGPARPLILLAAFSPARWRGFRGRKRSIGLRRDRFAEARGRASELSTAFDWPICFNRWTRERRWS